MQKFELNLRRRDIPVEELLADLVAVSIKLNGENVTRIVYEQNGNFGATTFIRKFGTWNKALETAGLTANARQNIPKEELFENLATVWTNLGRQPTLKDISKTESVSKFSASTYEKRFGSWNKTLLSFIAHVNTDEKLDEISSDELTLPTLSRRKRTGRTINWRLRAQVLIGDNCICKMCGASPAKDSTVQLHVDHIYPWAKGGETVVENLQTLCMTCNIGKSDEVF
jgi:HNH endonuclease/Homing endonuclease associated repeat